MKPPLFIFLLTLGLMPSALGQAMAPLPAHSAVSSSQPSTLRIGGGDLLDISVFGAPEYHYEMRVAEDGSIVLPLGGAVSISGLSVPEAESAIAKRLEDNGAFNHPQVTVFQKEYATQGVSVLGEVQKPGVYPLIGERHLLDAISAAGGKTPNAGSVVKITHRNDSSHPEIISVSYESAANPATNPVIQAGDTILVTKAGVVYVVGDVREPSGIVLSNPTLTVLQALAMAHGANPTAKLSKARIIRTHDGAPTQVEIPLDKILAAKKADQTLLAGDILFVPSSTAKSAARRGIEAVIQAATGIAVYKPLP